MFSLTITLAFICLAGWHAPLRGVASTPVTSASLSALRGVADVPQWRQLPGPGKVTVRAFLGSGQYLFAASNIGSVFRSANNGDNWTRVNKGLTPRIGEGVYSLAAIGTTIFAGTGDGVFRSTNNGDAWTKVSAGLPLRPVKALVVNGTTIFAGTTGAVFRSTDNGESWVAAGALQTGSDVETLIVNGTVIFAGTASGGVFRSVNNGGAWTAVNAGLTNLYITALGVAGTNLFAATGGDGVFLSTNNGDSWMAVNTGLTNLFARAIAAIGTTVFAGTDDGVFRSTDNGQSWAPASAGLTGRAAKSLGVIGTMLYVGTNDGVSRSNDNGANWAGVNAGLSNLQIYAFAAIGSKIFAATNGFAETDGSGNILSGGVYVTNDNGQSWRAVNNGLNEPYIGGFVAVGTSLFAATAYGVYRSTDQGESWKIVLGPRLDIAGGMVASGTTLYLRTTFAISRSTDNGDNWLGIRSTDLVTCLGASDTAVFLGTDNNEIFRSTDSGMSWRLVYGPPTLFRPIRSFAASGTTLLASSAADGVLLSTDNGASWRPVNTGLPLDPGIGPMAINGKDFYAVARNKVFRSTNQGASWETVSDELTPERITTLAVIGSKLFAGTGVDDFVSGGSELGGSGALVSDLPAGAVANVSAASFLGAEIASESITAAFGFNLATQTQSAASQPLPTDLAGTKVMVKDSLGVDRLAPLFFVSPQQINYLAPPGMADGAATFTVTSGDGKVSIGATQISRVAPGVFSANADGRGVAAATILRFKSDGSQIFEPMARFDPAQNRFVSIPVDLGPDLGEATDRVFLILFGTGFRFHTALSAVSATIGGTGAQVIYADFAPNFVGLDQANIRLPRSLAGRGEIDVALTVNGKVANIVKLNVK